MTPIHSIYNGYRVLIYQKKNKTKQRYEKKPTTKKNKGSKNKID